VDARGAITLEGLNVSGSAVALVLSKPILWIDSVQINHEPIPASFGDDGGGRDGKAKAVPFREAALGNRDSGNFSGIDEKVLRGYWEPLDGAPHGQ
jgi:hypothetical protein